MKKINLSFFFLGFEVSEEDLENVAKVSGVLGIKRDFIPSELRENFERILPNPTETKPEKYIESYLKLKYSFSNEHQDLT